MRLSVHKQLVRVLNKLKILQYFNFYVKYRHGISTYNIPVIQGVGKEIMWLDFANSWLVHLLSRFPGINQKTIIDVGVNMGQTLLGIQILSAETKYIGFEPNPVCIYYLEKLIDYNEFKKCQIIPAALSSKNDVLSFIVSSDTDDAGSIVQELRPDKFQKKQQSVCALKFDDIGISKNLGDTIIKIDVEGAELDVIKGMQDFIDKKRPLIICEVLHAHSASQLDFCQKRNTELCSILKQMDYNIFRIIKHTTAPEVADFEEIAAFDNEVYGNNSGMLCDYIFLPANTALPVL